MPCVFCPLSQTWGADSSTFSAFAPRLHLQLHHVHIGVNLYTFRVALGPPNVEFGPPNHSDKNLSILVGNDTQWRIFFSLNSNLLNFPLSTVALT